jgi:hypothetical protein
MDDIDLDAARAALHTADGWRKSTFSGGQNGCVEVNSTVPGYTGIRDSKLGSGSPVLVFNAVAIAAMIDGVKAGESDGQTQTH